MAAHSLVVGAAPTPAASSAPVVGVCLGGLGAALGAPLERVLGGALRRGAGALKGGAAPPVLEEAAAPVGAAMPSSRLECCWSVAGLGRGLRGPSAGPFVSPPPNASTCDPRMVGGGSSWELGDSPPLPPLPPASASIPSDEVEGPPSEMAEISYLVRLLHEDSRACSVLPWGVVSERARDEPTRPRAFELREISEARGCEADESSGVPGGVILKVDLTRPAIPIIPVGRPMRSCRCPADVASGPSATTACPACPAGRAAAAAEERRGVEEHDRSLASAEPAVVRSVGPGPLRGSAVGAAGGCTTNWSLSPGGAPGWTLSLAAARRRR